MSADTTTPCVFTAGLDEGLLSFSIPILVYMDNPLYKVQRMSLTNDSAPSYIHRPRPTSMPGRKGSWRQG
jgi:hypothetical protein